MNRQPTAGVPLDITGLSEGLNLLERRVGAVDLDLNWPEVQFSQEIELYLEVLRMGDNLQIDGRFHGTMHTTCDRCLGGFDHPLDGRFRLLGRRGDETTHELAEQDGIVFHDGHGLDISGEVRQAILLEVPIQNLCSPDCRGLCATCGADLNRGDCACERRAVDPRWADLGRLKRD